jgi:hypothetical protein
VREGIEAKVCMVVSLLPEVSFVADAQILLLPTITT